MERRGLIYWEKAIVDSFHDDSNKFSSDLVKLFMRAPAEDQYLLGIAYPMLSLAMRDWYQTKKEEEEKNAG